MVKLQGVTDSLILKLAKLYIEGADPEQVWVEYGTGEMNTDDMFNRDQAVLEASKQEIVDAIRKLEGIDANTELMNQEAVFLYQTVLSELYALKDSIDAQQAQPSAEAPAA